MSSNSANLVIPIILWGKDAPTHSISKIAVSLDFKSLVTGCADGHLVIWDLCEEQINPKCFLIGHTGAITSLAFVHSGQQTIIVSCSENGELVSWDSADGRCIENTKTSYIHTFMQSYAPCFTTEPKLFSTGFYPDVHIINPITLELILTLSSHVNPDWITSIHVLRPNKKLDDVILSLTVSGTVKVWTINESEFKCKEVFETESKHIRLKNSRSLVCCAYNNRTVLIVNERSWQIFDAGDFVALCDVAPPKGELWNGGNFTSSDKVIIWGNSGKSYLFKLPSNCIVENKDFHKMGLKDEPFLYCTLVLNELKPPISPPPTFYITTADGKFLIRGDSDSNIFLWKIPDVNSSQILQISQAPTPPEMPPKTKSSLQNAWDQIKPTPPGMLDQFDTDEGSGPMLTCSIYLSHQSRFVCGREDGSIVVVPATHTIMLHLLHGRHQQYEDWPLHHILLGHKGKVNCLVYPHGVNSRYDPAYLVSGGRDFSVILWDIVKCDLIHRFCVQSGEILQIIVPPAEVSPRFQQTVCSVANDHSAALLSLRETKCVLLASRHLFPISCIKFRPLDDFLIIGTSDGSVFVWQMETGNLDRVLHGIAGMDVLQACDENGNLQTDSGLANPAVHFFRGLKSGNLSAIRHAAQRVSANLVKESNLPLDPLDHNRQKIPPLIVQGLRTNESDQESHVLFFDIEALIIQLLSEEYSALSPSTLESQGLINQTEYQKILQLTHSASPDAQKKIADFFGKVKDKAGDMERLLKDKDKHGFMAKVKEGAEKIQSKAESAMLMKAEVINSRKSSTASLGLEVSNTKRNRSMLFESTIPMEIAQLLLSLLLGWGLDPELDNVSETRLGLLKPLVPASFGQISRGGFTSLMSPTFTQKHQEEMNLTQRVKNFTSIFHWEMSNSITTNHLLAIVSLANTLMCMNNATFIPEQERIRRANRPSTKGNLNESTEAFVNQQAASKHGWSLIATLHCVMLNEKVNSEKYKKPLVEVLALRWQDRCVEVRDASQALLLAELSRIGPDGRKQLVDEWSSYLPNVGDAFSGSSNGSNTPMEEDEGTEFDDDEIKPDRVKRQTAIIILGVIGAEFGSDITGRDEQRKGVEGFGLGNSNLARQTSKSLTYLLLNPGRAIFSSLRRAAIDLIGRGFTVWEPFLDVSKVLLAILELCCEADQLVPSMAFGLPLTPQSDACRTARNALTQIATQRPAAFITTMAREVARYVNLAQNAQAIQINLNNVILNRSKPEILRIIELLIEKMQNEICDLIVEVMDIVLHCVDSGHLKTKGLGEVFPVLCKFSQVTHCPATRRIAVGAKNGNLTIYELRSSKCQTIPAHCPQQITACAFSADGKFLVSYSCTENKMHFWQQSSSGMFGLGHTQTRCVRTINTVPIPDNAKNNIRPPKLVWTGNRNVSLFLADGSENRYGV